MTEADVIERFEELAERYDALHRPGAWHRLKAELDLGSGPFNDKLTIDELKELNQELQKHLSTPKAFRTEEG